MSKKLQQAIQQGIVRVRNCTAGVVAITVASPSGTPVVIHVTAGTTMELAPKHTTAVMVQHGNLDYLVGKGFVAVV
jgi:hypothetical protein